MKSAPSEPSDLVIRLRQQLILAQVRIMELEDARDGLAPRLAELEQLLKTVQNLADQKLDEAAHLEKVLADLQAHCDRLQQAGVELATTRAALVDAMARVTQRDEAVRQIETELKSVKSSRSWRWTAWLRSLGGKP